MALPTLMTAAPDGGFRRSVSGVVLGLYPSTNSKASIELWHSSANSTASSVWNKIRLDPVATAELQFPIHLPASTRTRYFKAKHVADGYGDSLFTPTVSAKPIVLDDRLSISLPMRNAVGNVEMPQSNLFLSSAKTAIVGTQASTARQQRILELPAVEFVARTSTMKWNQTAGYLQLAGTATTLLQDYRVPVTLPTGAVIKGLSMRTQRAGAGATGGVIACLLAQVKSSDGSALSLVSLSNLTTGTAWVTTTGSTSVVVSSSRFYMLQISMRAPGVSAMRFQKASVRYEFGTYSQAI